MVVFVFCAASEDNWATGDSRDTRGAGPEAGCRIHQSTAVTAAGSRPVHSVLGLGSVSVLAETGRPAVRPVSRPVQTGLSLAAAHAQLPDPSSPGSFLLPKWWLAGLLFHWASAFEWKIATRTVDGCLLLCKCLAVIVARILHNHDTLQMIRRFQFQFSNTHTQHARVIINVTPH